MRRFRAFLGFAGQHLRQPGFWIFLIAIVLIGPIFVLLHSETNLAEREMRPLLSESSSVEHFNTKMFTPWTYANKEAVLLFREPGSESSPEHPISPVFLAGWRLLPPVDWSRRSTWSLPLNGSLSDFYRWLFPILTTVAGILVFPSRRRFSVLRTLLPCGRWGCFFMIAGVLVLQIVLLGTLSGASTWLALILTQGASGTTWFVVEYFAVIIVYGLGFALLGIVVAELVRSRVIALLVGLVLVVVVWPFFSIGQTSLYVAVSQWSGTIADPEPYQYPVHWITSILLVPPESTFELLGITIERLASGYEDPYVTHSNIRLGAALLGARLVAFAGFWFAIGWVAFPRTVRMMAS